MDSPVPALLPGSSRAPGHHSPGLDGSASEALLQGSPAVFQGNGRKTSPSSLEAQGPHCWGKIETVVFKRSYSPSRLRGSNAMILESGGFSQMLAFMTTLRQITFLCSGFFICNNGDNFTYLLKL